MSDSVDRYKMLVVSDSSRLPNQCEGSMFFRSPVKRLP